MRRCEILETLFDKVDLSFAEAVVNESYRAKGSLGRPSRTSRRASNKTTIRDRAVCIKSLIKHFQRDFDGEDVDKYEREPAKENPCSVACWHYSLGVQHSER
jgi:hypothetical protein